MKNQLITEEELNTLPKETIIMLLLQQTITVTQTVEENRVVVRIADNGCGMDKKTKMHLFDKFYQGDTSHSVEGNGLGMALAKKAVDMFHGEITVESEPGKGTQFMVSLPVN